MAVCAVVGVAGTAAAEPHFAIETGHKCQACHVNPTGGGKRTAYGNAFTQLVLTRRPITKFWDGSVDRRLRVGADVRASLGQSSIPNQKDSFAFDFEEALVYVELRLLEDQLTLYLDQRVAPGGATNREAYALYRFLNGRGYAKAGRLFLPYGWRLEDDSEFIRQVPGINYATPDDGVEVGVELPRASVQLALTNGTAGGGDVDTGKQLSLRASHHRSHWRIGSSVNFNATDFGNRRMFNLFGGIRTGRINWLAELDYISDDTFVGGQRTQVVGFAEANLRYRRGHNLRISYGWFDPDENLDEDERARYSIVWEYFPIPFTQISLGARINDGIPQNDLQNRDEFFLQLHGFF